MRQPTANSLLLDAVPDQALRPLVLELLALLNGRTAPPATASAPAPAAPAPQQPKRGPGWLKGRPRGPRKMIPAASNDAAGTAIASPADPMADARRTRKNQARSAKRAAARLAGGLEKPSAVETKATDGAGTASAPTPQQPKRPQGWPKGRPRGPRKSATGQSVQAPAGNKAGNGAAHATPSTASSPAARLWARAATLAPTTPWRVVAREFGTNEAQAQDAHRTGTLPPGIAAAALERFLEAPPAA